MTNIVENHERTPEYVIAEIEKRNSTIANAGRKLSAKTRKENRSILCSCYSAREEREDYILSLNMYNSSPQGEPPPSLWQ